MVIYQFEAKWRRHKRKGQLWVIRSIRKTLLFGGMHLRLSKSAVRCYHGNADLSSQAVLNLFNGNVIFGCWAKVEINSKKVNVSGLSLRPARVSIQCKRVFLFSERSNTQCYSWGNARRTFSTHLFWKVLSRYIICNMMNFLYKTNFCRWRCAPIWFISSHPYVGYKPVMNFKI